MAMLVFRENVWNFLMVTKMTLMYRILFLLSESSFVAFNKLQKVIFAGWMCQLYVSVRFINLTAFSELCCLNVYHFSFCILFTLAGTYIAFQGRT